MNKISPNAKLYGNIVMGDNVPPYVNIRVLNMPLRLIIRAMPCFLL